MKIGPLTKLPPRWRWAGLTCVGLLIAACAGYFYLTSPERVVHRTLSALARQDAPALVALASEKERQVMNLTPQTVEACLRETYWRDSATKPVTVVRRYRTLYADILAYPVDVTGFSPDGKPRRFEVTVYQDPTGRWRLALSQMLYIFPRVCNGVEGDHAPVWDALARRSGIKGAVHPDGAIRWADGSFSPKVYLTRK
jgi:hypothetical protein